VESIWCGGLNLCNEIKQQCQFKLTGYSLLPLSWMVRLMWGHWSSFSRVLSATALSHFVIQIYLSHFSLHLFSITNCFMLDIEHLKDLYGYPSSHFESFCLILFCLLLTGKLLDFCKGKKTLNGISTNIYQSVLSDGSQQRPVNS